MKKNFSNKIGKIVIKEVFVGEKPLEEVLLRFFLRQSILVSRQPLLNEKPDFKT